MRSRTATIVEALLIVVVVGVIAAAIRGATTTEWFLLIPFLIVTGLFVGIARYLVSRHFAGNE